MLVRVWRKEHSSIAGGIASLYGYAKVDDLYELPLWLIFVLFCWDYKQLYRCTWWRSFWRTILMLTYSLVLLVIFACLVMALMLAGIYVLKFIL